MAVQYLKNSMKSIHLLIISIILFVSCGLNEEDEHAKKNMIQALNEEFLVPNDTSFYITQIESDIMLSNEISTTPTQIDSFRIIKFNSLEKYFRHDDKILLVAYDLKNVAGHYGFPEIKGATYLPDSVVKVYNNFSRTYNGVDTLNSNSLEYYENVINYMKNYVENAPAPFYGYRNNTSLEIAFDNRKQTFEWVVYFDRDKEYLSYDLK